MTTVTDPRRLAVLVPFTDGMALLDRHPHDGAKVAAALARQRPHWRVDSFHVARGEWPDGWPDDLGGCDGVVITGSPASVLDPLPWMARLEDTVRRLHADGVPMVGLCFGHQVIAQALGGRVERSPAGFRIGVTTLSLQGGAPWIAPAVPAVRLHLSHEDHVAEPPAGATVLAHDEACPVMAYRIGHTVFTTQCHPEFDRQFMDDIIDELGPRLDPAMAARGRAQLAGGVDAPLVWRWIADFFDQGFVAPSPR